MEFNEGKRYNVEKVICSGIPELRILAYFDQEALEDIHYNEKKHENGSECVTYHFDACLITVRSNPNPGIIRPVVPMTDIVFYGDEIAVDFRMEKYRKYFLSAGG